MNTTALADADESVTDLADRDIHSLTEAELDVLERQLVAKYLPLVPWSAVVWGLGNLMVWLSLWPLVLLDVLPLWLAFPLAAANVALAYLPSHEAQHNIIGGRGSKLRWLNELVGHLSPIPLVYPYRVLRATHMEHHAHTNDPERDPDYDVHASGRLQFFWKSLLNRQPGSGRSGAYPASLMRQGKSELMIDAIVFQTVYSLILFACALTGHALEAALLWWLPRHLAITYIEYYLSWAPHHPGNGQGRYRDTRGFRSRLGNLLSLGMQFHIVHHLYPRIPLAKTPAAYRELKPILERRGCDLGQL